MNWNGEFSNCEKTVELKENEIESPKEIKSSELDFTFSESSNDTDDGISYQTQFKKTRID